METKYKQFRPFDKVLVKDSNHIWKIDFYNYFDHTSNGHRTLSYQVYRVPDRDILPYEGNEKLLGTTDEPEEEIKLENGEYLFVINDIAVTPPPTWWNLIQLDYVNSYVFFDVEGGKWYYAIRFSDFNPNDMEETRKHILYIKNGRIIKYEGKSTKE